MSKNKDEAVSEVVGVLLMLTVTIILAGTMALVVNNSAGEQNTPISANIAATDTDNTGIILELISGDSFSLDSVSIRLGIREDSSKYVVLKESGGVEKYLKSYTNSRIITIGDRFKIVGDKTNEGGYDIMKFGDFSVKYGQHVSYIIYDSSGAPFSSGDILIK